MTKIDADFTTRTLLAMRHEVETQGNAYLQGLALYNALAREHEIEPVALTIPNIDPVHPTIRREQAVSLRLMDMGLRLDRTHDDDRRYRVVCANTNSAPDDCTLTLDEIEALVPALREITGKLWSPAAVDLLKDFVAGKGWVGQ
jgi:hypothetical protein